MGDSVKERLSSLEATLRVHTDQQSKNWTTVFDMMNDKVMPAVEMAKQTKADLNVHRENHWKFIGLVITIVGILLTASKLFSHK